MVNARLGWFSPLGVAASIRASARWLAFGFTASAFRHAPLRSCRSAGWFFRLPLRSCRSAGWSSGSPLRKFRSAGWRFRLPLRSGRWASWPSGSRLPLFGMHRFGVAAGRIGLRAHCFRFSARTASEWLLGEFVLPPSASEIALGGLAFGFTASAFRHAPLRKFRSVVGLRVHRFRFSACAASEIPFGGLAFGLIASAFRHGLLRSGRWASSFFPLPLRKLPSAGWPSDSLLPLFGMRRSAPPRRRSEDRRSTPTRQLFHFKTLIPTC